MRLLVIGAAVFATTLAWGQAPPSQVSPEVQQIQAQLNQVGCQAENMASAQTIANLQKQIADLKAKADPPPKSGATKK
jgi:outer membrane murein-binding lipoprotein Lpp